MRSSADGFELAGYELAGPVLERKDARPAERLVATAERSEVIGACLVAGLSYTLGRFPTAGDPMRRGARSVLKWFSALYVVLIIVQVFLAGEGIFGLYNIKHSDDCDKAGAHCIANSKTLDPHRALGFFLTLPGALLFLIVALVAWLPNKRARVVSIVAPILTFIQMILPGLGRWGGAFHPLNAILILVLYAWLFHELRRDATGELAPQSTGAPAPTG